jgi:hypothetical protein
MRSETRKRQTNVVRLAKSRPIVSLAFVQNELDIVRDVSARLQSAEIDFMLTGSMAMNYSAQPRMTRDIDIVVALAAGDTDTVVRLFHPDYYVSREAVSEAITQESIFNLIHQESIKVDCIVRKSSPYRRAEFERRQRFVIEDFSTWIASKEDLIISKLAWAKDSGSEIRDVKTMQSLTDTPPEIAEMVRIRLMAFSGAERFLMGVRMFDAARRMVLASLPANLSPSERKRLLFERLYGESLPSEVTL